MGGFGGPTFGTPPFGGDSDVSSLDFIFQDTTPYADIARRRAYHAAQNASLIVTDPHAFVPVIPTISFVFEDTTPYRQRAIAASARTRQSYIADVSWWQNFIVQPSMDWVFNDSHPYRQIQTTRLAQDHARRSHIADASGYQNFVFTVPNFGYHFNDSHPYRQLAERRLAQDRTRRNWVAEEGAIAFAAGFPAISTDFIFNDSHPYRQLAEFRRQQRFNRNQVADFPPQANLVAPFVNPAGWYPVTNPIARPIYQRRSFFAIGLPDDIGGRTVTPAAWLPEYGYPDPRYRIARRTQDSFIAVPVNTEAAIVNPPAFDPGFSTANIVGALLHVCADVRTMLAVKINSATVCEQLRTYTVPANTEQLCQTFIKDPQSVVDFSIDWTAPLAGSSDSILTSTWTADAGIIVVSSTYVTDTTTVFLSGGTDQTRYKVTNLVTTAGGRTLAQDLVISVVLQ